MAMTAARTHSPAVGLAGLARLEVLRLGTGWGTPRMHLAVGACLAASAATLHKLDLHGSSGLTPGTLATMTRLSHLAMRHCADFTGAGLAGARALTALHASDCAAIAPSAAVATPEGSTRPLPHLAEVELRGVPDVTGGAVTAWLPSVRTLTVEAAPGFVGAALGGLPALATLAVRWCPPSPVPANGCARRAGHGVVRGRPVSRQLLRRVGRPPVSAERRRQRAPAGVVRVLETTGRAAADSAAATRRVETGRARTTVMVASRRLTRAWTGHGGTVGGASALHV